MTVIEPANHNETEIRLPYLLKYVYDLVITNLENSNFLIDDRKS